jgi:hypothetical protein
MQSTDKLLSDLDATLRREQGAPEARRLEAIRRFFYGQFRDIPGETLAALFTTFLEEWRSGEDRALAWLGSVSSILLGDYDGAELSREQWVDIKESVVLSSGEIDLELLNYIMGLVLDHGAL